MYAILILLVVSMIIIYVAGELTEREVLKPQVRKIRGLSAIEDAVDRAKEMGRPVLFATAGSLQLPENIAALNILGYVAKRGAEIGVTVQVGVGSSQVVPYVREILATSASAVGKPEVYRPENAIWWSDNFVTYELGLVQYTTDNEPAAYLNFGWIQDENIVVPVHMFNQGIDCFCMAGTKEIGYVAVSLLGVDDWLLSEELFAASAYVIGTKESSGRILAGDILKIAVLVLLVVGAALTLTGSSLLIDLLTM